MRKLSGPLTEHDQAKRFIGNYLWPKIKESLAMGDKLRITVQDETRTADQNAKFHAMCDDVASSGMQWAGKRRTAAEWKVLFVSGHAVATKEGSDVVLGLEGEFINLRESTAQMSVRRGSSLIQYTIAFCDMNEIKLSD